MKKLLLLLTLLVSCAGFVQAEEASYKIVFKTGTNTSTTFNSNTNLSGVIESGADFLSSVQSATNSFPTTKEGIRVGSASGAGNVIFNTSASGKVKATKLVVTAKGSKDASRLAIDKAASSSYGTTIGTSDYSPYTFNLDGSELSQIKLYGFSRVYVQSIEVVYEVTEVGPVSYAFDKNIPATLKVGSAYQIVFGDKYPTKNFKIVSLNENVATVTDGGLITAVAPGTADFMASWYADNNFKAGDYEFSIEVTEPVQGAVTEELVFSNFKTSDGSALEGGQNNYRDCEYTSDLTGITYKANMATGNESIQLRSTNSNSGIVVAANPNGLILASVEVEWNTISTNGRTLDFYGSHKAFNAASELYNNTGAKLDNESIVKGTNTTMEENLGEYNFIGMRSKLNAMYLDKIILTWVPAVTPDKPVVTVDGNAWEVGMALTAGQTIKFEGKPGQHLHYITGNSSAVSAAMHRAPATEGWTAAESHAVTMPVPEIGNNETMIYRAKMLNGSLTHESEEVMFGVNSKGETTGVEAVEAEAAEGAVEWYNLQGVRVENPQSGLYIRRQGNKVEKVAVK